MAYKLKEFKNGNIRISYKKDNCFPDNIDDFYNDVLNMSDYSINYINGYPYITNIRTNNVYDLSNHFNICNNVLQQIDNHLLIDKKPLKLYRLSKKESKELLQDMQNGY